MSYEKLMRVLETDSEDGLIGLTIERIKELGTENAEKQEIIDGLEREFAVENERKALLKEQDELKKQIAQQKANIIELDKEGLLCSKHYKARRAIEESFFKLILQIQKLAN